MYVHHVDCAELLLGRLIGTLLAKCIKWWKYYRATDSLSVVAEDALGRNTVWLLNRSRLFTWPRQILFYLYKSILFHSLHFCINRLLCILLLATKTEVLFYVISHRGMSAFVCVDSTYWKQRTGPHPGFWHAAPADAQSLNTEGKGSYSTTLACHGCKPPVYLQHRVHVFSPLHCHQAYTQQMNVTQLSPSFVWLPTLVNFNTIY